MEISLSQSKKILFVKLEQCNLERLGIILPSPFRNPEVRQYKILLFRKNIGGREGRNPIPPAYVYAHPAAAF